MTNITRFNAQLRSAITGQKLHGHAAVFDQIALIQHRYYERLERGVFDAVLSNPDTDVRSFVNHDSTLLLGRQSNGTLRVGVDSEGLEFEVDLPNTTYANDLREVMERGDLDSASFGFLPGKDRWDRAPDGRQLQTHISIRHLYDVSPVSIPAYSGAGSELRNVTFETRNHAKSQLIRARARVHLGRV